MKIEIHEYDGCFSFCLEAENVADAATIARLNHNATIKLLTINACASRNGTFTGAVVVGKKRKSSSYIINRIEATTRVGFPLLFPARTASV